MMQGASKGMGKGGAGMMGIPPKAPPIRPEDQGDCLICLKQLVDSVAPCTNAPEHRFCGNCVARMESRGCHVCSVCQNEGAGEGSLEGLWFEAGRLYLQVGPRDVFTANCFGAICSVLLCSALLCSFLFFAFVFLRSLCENGTDVPHFQISLSLVLPLAALDGTVVTPDSLTLRHHHRQKDILLIGGDSFMVRQT